jgi:hypothetical protein
MFLHSHEQIRKMIRRLQLHFLKAPTLNLTDLAKQWMDMTILNSSRLPDNPLSDAGEPLLGRDPQFYKSYVIILFIRPIVI